MNRKIILLIAAGCAVLIILSWVVVLSTKSTAEKQQILIGRAREYINDGIYIMAASLLEEAAGYDGAHTITAENELKEMYLHLIESKGFSRKYISLLEKQMSRKNCPPEVFIEAAEYYLSTNAKQKAYEILKNAIHRTENSDIKRVYEGCRYAFDISRTTYDETAAIYNQTIQVRQGEKWGIASVDGGVLIPCEYEKISTFSNGRAVVKKDSVIYAVDKNNNRIALASSDVQDFSNLAENRVSLLRPDGWYRASENFQTGTNVFEDIGMYSGGYAAAKANGSWGVIDTKMNWLILPEYDGVITDELGRCYAQGAVFVRSGDNVYLRTAKGFLSDRYQDARPFSDEGYAAVKKENKWGFIDTGGDVKVDFIFDDALSFGQHLAAVKIGDLWGYISINGQVVIDAVFVEAKSFSGGSAPVLTERGWQLITLIEYKRGATL
ncbi:MAG: WG repeat-containing protein [Oscillospiraceae bacterium]|nr:WG repeat-containing protein [Oscillospiraceae bacterium]